MCERKKERGGDSGAAAQLVENGRRAAVQTSFDIEALMPTHQSKTHPTSGRKLDTDRFSPV